MAARKNPNTITITFEVPGKSEKDVRAFVDHVITNDLLLRGRKEGAPEGAGSWGHLLAAFAGIEVKDANALVPFIRVIASEQKAAGTKAPAKAPTTVAKAAAPAPSEELVALAAQVADLSGAVHAIIEHIGKD